MEEKNTNCPFCPMFENNDAFVMDIEPLNPVVKGHRIVFAKWHTEDFTQNYNVTSVVMNHAIEVARRMGDVNLITSKGVEATQTVKHLHIHLVPRTKGDGLHLPWTGQIKD